MTTQTRTIEEWKAIHVRERRQERASWRRSRFALVINRGITPDELPKWYRLRDRPI